MWGNGWQSLPLKFGNSVDLQRGFITLSESDTKNGEARSVPLTTTVRQALTVLFKVRSLLTNKIFLYNGGSVCFVKKTFKMALKKAAIQNFRFPLL